MFRTFGIAVVVVGLAVPSVAISQQLSVVQVFGEIDDDLNRTCQARHDSAISAVEAALRYNRVEVGNTTVKAYVNIGAIRMADTLCAVNVRLQFYENTYAVLPKLGSRYVAAELCDKGGMLTGSPAGMQSRINSIMRDMTDACVSEIAKDG